MGSFAPNPWGLYDVHGNVAEGCIDIYDPKFYAKCAANKMSIAPVLVPDARKYPHEARAGSWDDEAATARSAARKASTKDWKAQDPQIPQSIWYLTDASFVGLRVVRPLRVPTPEEAKQYDVGADQLQEIEDYAKARAANWWLAPAARVLRRPAGFAAGRRRPTAPARGPHP